MDPRLRDLLRQRTIEQRSTEWKDLRKKFVTASEFAVIIGRNPYETKGNLFRRKVGLMPEKQSNEAMKWGQDKEDEAIREYERRENIRVVRLGLLMHHKTAKILEGRQEEDEGCSSALIKNKEIDQEFPLFDPSKYVALPQESTRARLSRTPLLRQLKLHGPTLIPVRIAFNQELDVDNFFWLRGSPDGITERGTLVEIKCPYRRKDLQDLHIPEYYIIQVQVLLEICNLEEGHLVYYVPPSTSTSTSTNTCAPSQTEAGYLKTVIKRDRDWFQRHKQKAFEFWKEINNYLVTKRVPPKYRVNTRVTNSNQKAELRVQGYEWGHYDENNKHNSPQPSQSQGLPSHQDLEFL